MLYPEPAVPGLEMLISGKKEMLHKQSIKDLLNIQNQPLRKGPWCKIPLACSHLRVKCYAGRVKVLTICVVLSNLQHLREKMET